MKFHHSEYGDNLLSCFIDDANQTWRIAGYNRKHLILEECTSRDNTCKAARESIVIRKFANHIQRYHWALVSPFSRETTPDGVVVRIPMSFLVYKSFQLAFKWPRR